MTKVGAAEPLGDDEGFRVRMAAVIEPRHIIESGGSDNQNVAFPLAGRVPQPRAWSIGFERAFVQVDLPEHGFDFVQDHDHAGRLDDAVWPAAGSPIARDAVWQTVILGIVAAEGLDALVEESLSPWSHGYIFRLEVGGEVPIVFEVRTPHAGKVGFPVGRPWHGARQIRLAIGCTRHARISWLHPLGGGSVWSNEDKDHSRAENSHKSGHGHIVYTRKFALKLE